MTRYCGQYMKVRNAILVLGLEDDVLYGAAEVTATKIDRRAEPALFNRVRSALWDFGSRYGLTDDPDNALRNRMGKVILGADGKPVLQEGERWSKLLGSRWKNYLGGLEKETPVLMDRLTSALSHRIFTLEAEDRNQAQEKLISVLITRYVYLDDEEHRKEAERLVAAPIAANLGVEEKEICLPEPISRGTVRWSQILEGHRLLWRSAVAIAFLVLFAHGPNRAEHVQKERSEFSAFAQDYLAPIGRRTKSTSFLFCCSAQDSQEDLLDPYETGLEIIKEQGITEGLKYFREQAIGKDDATSLFYLGWSFFREGSNRDAEEIAHFVIANSKEGSTLSGNCFYLLGQISSAEGAESAAYAWLNKALQIFRDRKGTQGEFNALCSLASLSIKTKAFDQGNGYLQDARRLQESSPQGQKWGMGYYWEIQSRVSFGLGSYQDALEASIESKKEYQKAGDQVRANNTLSGIAFFQMLTGQVEEGVVNTKKVEDLIYQTEDDYKVLSYYNGVNVILAHKCSGQPFEKIEQELREYIGKKNDLLLLEHLEFALNWKCAPEDSHWQNPGGRAHHGDGESFTTVESPPLPRG